ncbi:hypothetical protein T02_1426 [Trichinella nativa]|uniref:Uncharacterized protein n=1 Tax=Trichinella nativa TaxID=6335 RepID=A0A0V1KJM6_9BILA|nr:hypothetical protein T02_1426 [Trichinella nativa]
MGRETRTMFEKGICVKSSIVQYSDITPGNELQS